MLTITRKIVLTAFNVEEIARVHVRARSFASALMRVCPPRQAERIGFQYKTPFDDTFCGKTPRINQFFYNNSNAERIPASGTEPL